MPNFKIETNKIVKCKEFVLTELSTPINNLDRLVSINILGNCASQITIEYRFSQDGHTWSEWKRWSEWNVPKTELTWLGFRVLSDTQWQFDGIDLEWTGGDLIGDCQCSIIKYNDESFIIDCGTGNQYEYNNALAFVSNWEKMSNEVFNRFGWSVVYFKCDPVLESKDVVFKEYSLLQVRKCKQMKVVVPDNDFGSGDYQFTEYDIDFSDDLPFQISKELFWAAFGNYEQPQEKDFLYFPLEGRMYRINSVQESKDFMRKSIWWKGTMVKWNESDSLIKDEETKNTINEFTLNFEDVGFDFDSTQEEIDITNEQQYVVRAVGKSDNVREFVNIHWEKSGTKEKNLDNYFTIFSKYHYDLRNTSIGEDLIIYQNKINLVDNFSMMFWFCAQNRNTQNNNTWVTIFSDTNNTMTFDVLVNNSKIQKIRIKDITFSVDIPVGDWFAYYVGFNKVDNTLTLRIWERADLNKKTTKMSIKYECIQKLPIFVGTWKPKLLSGFDLITSIRFLKAPVTVENQSVLFTKLVFPDASKSYLIDDCYPLMYNDSLNTR
jgi:hypothetical protein